MSLCQSTTRTVRFRCSPNTQRPSHAYKYKNEPNTTNKNIPAHEHSIEVDKSAMESHRGFRDRADEQKGQCDVARRHLEPPQRLDQRVGFLQKPISAAHNMLGRESKPTEQELQRIKLQIDRTTINYGNTQHLPAKGQTDHANWSQSKPSNNVRNYGATHTYRHKLEDHFELAACLHHALLC